MSDKKIKIKELACELKVSNPDMLKAAMDEGISARNSAASVTPEEADRLRKHFDKLRGDDKSKEVIVRRRTGPRPPRGERGRAQAKSGEAPEAKPAELAADQAQSQPAGQEAPAAPVKAPVQEQAPQAEAKPQAEPQAQAPASEAPKEASALEAREGQAAEAGEDRRASDDRPREQAGGEAEAPRVRIISRPEAPAATAQPARRTERSDRPSGTRSERTDRGDRPSGPRSERSDRAPRSPRSDGQGRPPRSDGQGRPSRSDGQNRQDGARRGGPSQHARPARPGGAPGQGFRSDGSRGSRPSMGGFGGGEDQPLDSRSGQSKKKRNKGRRTVDFQAGGFGHHQEEHDAPRVRGKGHRKGGKPQAPAPVTQPLKQAKRKLRIENAIRVSDMAHQMGLKANEIIKVLFNLGIMATINQSIDFDTAAIVAAEFSYEVEKTGFEEKDYLEEQVPDKPEDLRPRPPVVTIMGHVDHGKTSLLDAIRKSHITTGEAGGITQHIGAYHVRTKKGEVVFLDTPGHEAFTAMRARGAQITDLVILVVAADDGVMEQTREAVNHARAANVPIIVAVNKIDKPGADPDRVLRELSELGLLPEDWGGDTIVQKVSAKTKEGLDDLLELLALQSEIMELKANPNKPAKGHIIEAKLDKGRGPVATVLVQEGTLRQGDNFVCGTFSGRVRALLNDQGKKVKEAGPSIPVEVQGFTGVPEAGEEFNAVADEKVARRIADARAVKQRESDLASQSKITLETFLASSADDEQKTLNLVLKADVQGTLEAVQESLKKASTDKVNVNVVHAGTGAISESDILLASASKAIIIGFNIRPTATIKNKAAHENVDIRFYDIIYKLVDDVKNAMAGLLAPVEKEVYLGQAEVRQTFTLPKVGTIAGAFVADGKIVRNAGVRLLRDGVVVHTGRIGSLKRFKDDAKEVLHGNECGIGIENFNDVKVGDIIEAFDTVQEAATL